MAEIEKAMHPAALSEKYQTKKKSVTLFPVQQPILPFQLADVGQILADLQASAVVSAGIPDREVADINKFAPQFDPEGRRVPGA